MKIIGDDLINNQLNNIDKTIAYILNSTRKKAKCLKRTTPFSKENINEELD